MGVNSIVVCHDCKCYADLDQMDGCWNEWFWDAETYDARIAELQERKQHQLIYELAHAQMLCRFYAAHIGHNVKTYSDDDYNYNVLENVHGLEKVSIYHDAEE